MPRPQSSLTFRLALETFEDVKTQLFGLTEEAKTITQAVDNLKSTVQKKRKEVQRLMKKMAGKRKSLRALEKKSGKAVPKSNPSVDDVPIAPGAFVDVLDATFIIEDVNVSAAETEILSARKRKRFAGIWNASSISADSFHVEAQEDRGKRPRHGSGAASQSTVEETSWTSTAGVVNDENLAPLC